MKRNFLFVLCILVLVISLAAPVAAQDAQLDYVTDTAGLLSEEQLFDLQLQAEEISQSYGCGVYILVLDDFTEYAYASDVYDAATELYTSYDLGLGSDDSGILLLLSMAERDYALIAHGYGNTAFTDYGKDHLSEEFLDDFADDAWEAGFSDYLETCETLLEMAKDGAPMDIGNHPSARLYGILACIVLGLLVALIVRGILRGSMRSVAKKTEAAAYTTQGIQLTEQYDRFTHITQTRVKVESSKSSSGGTSVGKNGFSGKSGKF